MPDKDLDEKLERASKAIGIFKQLGEVFKGNQNPNTTNAVFTPDSIDDKWVNSIFFIERQIREIVPAQELILKKLDILLERTK